MASFPAGPPPSPVLILPSRPLSPITHALQPVTLAYGGGVAQPGGVASASLAAAGPAQARPQPPPQLLYPASPQGASGGSGWAFAWPEQAQALSPRAADPAAAPLGGGAAKPSSISELLLRQARAAEEVLACNRAISDAVRAHGGAGGPAAVAAPPGGAAPASPRGTGGQAVGPALLAEPLLGAQGGEGPRLVSGAVHAQRGQAGSAAPASSLGAVGPDLAEPLLGAAGGEGPRPWLPPAAGGQSETSASLKGLNEPRPQLSLTLGRPSSPTKSSASLKGLNHVRDKVEEILDTYKKRGSRESIGEYDDSGFCVAVATSPLFQIGTLVLIALNTLWIAVDTDGNTAEFLDEAPVVFQVVDNMFCLFFTFELLVRLLALKRIHDAVRDAWLLFDIFLVTMMAFETWVLSLLHAMWGFGAGSSALRGGSVLRIFRIMRLTRIARMARLMRSLPELLVLVKGLTVAIRSVTCSLGLLLLVIYCFAVLFVQLLRREEVLDGAFSNVPWAMHMLLMQVVCGFDEDLITKLLHLGWLYYALLLTYVLLGSLTIMNLLIGIICEVVANVASVEKQGVQWEILKERVHALIRQLDLDNSGLVSEDEFMELMDKPEVLEELESMGVDVAAFVDFVHFVFKDIDELSVREFLKMLKPFQGENVARVKDLVDVNKFITISLRNFEQRLFSNLEEHLVSRLEGLDSGRPA